MADQPPIFRQMPVPTRTAGDGLGESVAGTGGVRAESDEDQSAATPHDECAS